MIADTSSSIVKSRYVLFAHFRLVFFIIHLQGSFTGEKKRKEKRNRGGVLSHPSVAARAEPFKLWLPLPHLSR